ncbi:HAD-IA family hydrolase [Sphingomonas sp. Mn802worker]|uniref:HAD-IA family hydrolase n=1 Tax=Sphingomonas sp. Mn802worker TaxID=629773 RepID=UPI0003805D3F|nr:HAD-IA family hydrolase [Sphingomonas sp. Mn802worker]
MTFFPFAIVGFDLDGTLVDTSRDLAASVNHTLAAAGRAQLPVERITTMVGGGARKMLAQALDATGGDEAGELDALHDVLLDHYAAHICVDSVPYAGIVDALDSLRARNVTLGIVTNKLERFTRPLLDQLRLADRFAAIISGDTLGAGMTKPLPAPIHAMIERCGGGRAAFVGDSIYDVSAAHAAGIPALVYRGGFTLDGVDRLGADGVIDDYDQLIAMLEQL